MSLSPTNNLGKLNRQVNDVTRQVMLAASQALQAQEEVDR